MTMVIIKICDEPRKHSHFGSEEMEEYIEKYGEHFNEKMSNFAVSKMSKYNEVIQPISKETVDKLLSAYDIVLDNNKLWDYVYVANMGKADFYGSSIVDELHLAKYIKDVIDDEDAYEGIVFNRWLTDIHKKNITIDWESMI